MPQVQVIPPIGERTKKLRVAAYARVSSDSEEQLNSFATQVAYYTALIAEKEDWEFAGLYADEGVTGTSTAKREDFHRLLEDCRAGKIDRILVNSSPGSPGTPQTVSKRFGSCGHWAYLSTLRKRISTPEPWAARCC